MLANKSAARRTKHTGNLQLHTINSVAYIHHHIQIKVVRSNYLDPDREYHTNIQYV